MCLYFLTPLQALSNLLQCQTLEEVKLSGRDMFSLKELVLNRSSQVRRLYLNIINKNNGRETPSVMEGPTA